MEIVEKYINNKFKEWNIRFIGLSDNADTDIAGNKKGRYTMEMTKRMETAGRALEKLHEGVAKGELTEMERDGLIQRFEFCFEIMWKCGKDYLLDREGLVVTSPKKVIRALYEVGLLNAEETESTLQMVDDRNMTAHTYDEKYAIELAERIKEYEKILQEMYRRMLK